jgi:hypothetical protein
VGAKDRDARTDKALVQGAGSAWGRCAAALAGVLEVPAEEIRVKD